MLANVFQPSFKHSKSSPLSPCLISFRFFSYLNLKWRKIIIFVLKILQCYAYDMQILHFLLLFYFEHFNKVSVLETEQKIQETFCLSPLILYLQHIFRTKFHVFSCIFNINEWKLSGEKDFIKILIFWEIAGPFWAPIGRLEIVISIPKKEEIPEKLFPSINPIQFATKFSLKPKSRNSKDLNKKTFPQKKHLKNYFPHINFLNQQKY